MPSANDNDPGAGMPPPFDMEAEGAVLACLLIDPGALALVGDVLRPEHFYSEAHRQIYRATVAVHQAGHPVDVVTVGSHLRDSGRFAQAGGMAYLTQILNAAPTLNNVRAYAQRVRELWVRRQVILTCQNITARGYVSADDSSALLASLGSAVERLKSQVSVEDPIPTLSSVDLSSVLPPVPYLVPSLGLAPGPIALIAGYGYSRKTLAMQDLALAVATGSRLWGVYACRRGNVLHLDYEQGRNLTQERYQRLARGRGIDLAQATALSVGCLPTIYVDRDGGADTLARAFEGRALVIIDSLRAAAPSADENSSEIRRHLDVLTRAAERTSATVIVIHHARKPSKEQTDGVKFAIRGSSALFDACASVFVFEGAKGEATKVHHEKDRIRGQCVPSFGLDTVDVPGPHGEPHWGLRLVHMEGEQLGNDAENTSPNAPLERIREFMRAHSPFPGNRAALCAAVRLRRTDFFAALSVLESKGEVQVDTSAKGATWIRLAS